MQGKRVKEFTTTYKANSYVYLGRTNNAAKEDFVNGKIDDLRFYNKVLSKAKVDNLYLTTHVNDAVE